MLNKYISTGIFLLSAVTVFSITGCNSGMGGGGGSASLDSNIDSVSYAFGFSNGKQMTQRGMGDINSEVFLAGMKKALSEEDPKIPEEEFQGLIQNYMMVAQQKAQAKQDSMGKENLKEGQDFLAENKTKEGVKTTESGLQYKVIEEGSGPSPTAKDTVTVNYEGKLLDGTVFDTSYDKEEPVTFPLNRVIKGWTEGVQLMKEGATYRFFIPAELAYGTNPRPGGPIGPNETLIFKVELVEVK